MTWHDVAKEGLPPPGVPVLISWKDDDGGRKMEVAMRSDPSTFKFLWWEPVGHGGYEWEWDFSPESITHWAELPEPPREETT
jgi:hypothetical protein